VFSIIEEECNAINGGAYSLLLVVSGSASLLTSLTAGVIAVFVKMFNSGLRSGCRFR
jgi:hypothetical protein